MLGLLVFIMLSVVVHSTDIKERIQLTPPPMPGFNTMAYMGRWFMAFRKAPCSWSGSSYFSDYEQNVFPEGGNSLLMTLNWRKNGLCNGVTSRALFKQPGLFTFIDNMGDNLSGKIIVVATDYKNFVVHWGCTKMSATGTICEDPWLSTGTRIPGPPPGVVAMIENVLQSMWGVSVGELTKYSNKMPCGPKIGQGCKKL